VFLVIGSRGETFGQFFLSQKAGKSTARLCCVGLFYYSDQDTKKDAQDYRASTTDTKALPVQCCGSVDVQRFSLACQKV